MHRNEAVWDRIARVVLAVGLAVLGFGLLGGTLGTVVGVVAVIPLVTGLVGWCPLYQLFGVSTCPVRRAPSERSGGMAA